MSSLFFCVMCECIISKVVLSRIWATPRWIIFLLNLHWSVLAQRLHQNFHYYQSFKIYVISYTLIVSHFHEKRFPRICRNVVTIVPIQDCQGFVLFVNCFSLVYFERLADLSIIVHMWWNAYFFRMQPVESPMAFFCMFCRPRWFSFSTHAILLMFYSLCKTALFWLVNIFPIARNILPVDYLVVVWVCFFDWEFVVDFLPT